MNSGGPREVTAISLSQIGQNNAWLCRPTGRVVARRRCAPNPGDATGFSDEKVQGQTRKRSGRKERQDEAKGLRKSLEETPGRALSSPGVGQDEGRASHHRLRGARYRR